MIDHTGVGVSDFQKSKTFCLEAIAPLDDQLGYNIEAVCHEKAG
jgi:hypothetical protein